MTDKPTITQADREAAIVKTAYAIALSHSNYGDGEGNKRAFAIAADLKKKLPPTNIVSAAVTELQAEVERLRTNRNAVIRECADLVFPVVMQHIILATDFPAPVHNKAVQATGSAVKTAILALIEGDE